MAQVANNSSITTTQIQVPWTAGAGHNFIIMNLNDGPVRITVTPNNDLEFNQRHLNRSQAGVNHHSLVGDSFTLEGDTGLTLRLAASAVDSLASNNTVTFRTEDLHTGIRNPTRIDQGSVLIALQSDVSDALINVGP